VRNKQKLLKTSTSLRCATPVGKGQIPLRYLVQSWFEAGRRPAAS